MVEDDIQLERKLDNIMIGKKKLFVNLSRFNRKEQHEGNKGRNAVEEENCKLDKSNDERSYAQALKDGKRPSNEGIFEKNKQQTWRKTVTTPTDEMWNGIEYKTGEEETIWLSKCYVGVVHEYEKIESLDEIFKVEGYPTLKVTPMGGDKMLISALEGEDIEEILKDAGELMAKWFQSIRPWSEEDVAGFRYTWIQCFEIPVHAWNFRFFNSIACLVGSFVKADEDTVCKSRLDRCRMLIKTTSKDTILKTIKVKINNKVFSIRMIEEIGKESAVKITKTAINKELEQEDSCTVYAGNGERVPENDVVEDTMELLSKFKIQNGNTVAVTSNKEDANFLGYVGQEEIMGDGLIRKVGATKESQNFNIERSEQQKVDANIEKKEDGKCVGQLLEFQKEDGTKNLSLQGLEVEISKGGVEIKVVGHPLVEPACEKEIEKIDKGGEYDSNKSFAYQGPNFQQRNRRKKKGANLKKIKKKITKEKQMIEWKNFVSDLDTTGEEEEEEEEGELDGGKQISSDMDSLIRNLRKKIFFEATDVRKIGEVLGIDWNDNEEDSLKRLTFFLKRLRGSTGAGPEFIHED